MQSNSPHLRNDSIEIALSAKSRRAIHFQPPVFFDIRERSRLASIAMYNMRTIIVQMERFPKPRAAAEWRSVDRIATLRVPTRPALSMPRGRIKRHFATRILVLFAQRTRATDSIRFKKRKCCCGNKIVSPPSCSIFGLWFMVDGGNTSLRTTASLSSFLTSCQGLKFRVSVLGFKV